MDVIPQKELRNNVGEVLRRVEAGESLMVTVAGRPVAELRPAQRRRWVSGPALARVWQGPAPREMEDDLDRLDAEIVDPFAS
ncbi:type II toxin-antitoxin system prevent-host-death family antitoxin [Georgenia sp. TF02-10]|uniref:type II toxin-antitoxin system Phd/YefM family antitoxin n=1 Tax=Georgenia sp. TF02-10 TaxID=2917725 RepID=UPI001FA73AC0|nr:type II toxin-antitoxin system prevent-host-death family antitoxin [Georgenia sp. TF02-10]UNX53355.1 type II toxin-antitoxin system prevent-host-death family antitoxin [Georgenia sp. TF02-10]